ncbi:RagB/SusD family nutrient uptake outer membrane protein [Acanthopleuribacter pedis]|uniref:RagB/SusD family nutrient uptake outer membrane protein n=1 Tax=Acanthopleuribacter pedis TaxID=442870 RepID=A0A8J7QEJ4_9BACT|nr:RagB/SusD family nutrient uptake outer membrane protein [Acanthopleuribacter pedis]
MENVFQSEKPSLRWSLGRVVLCLFAALLLITCGEQDFADPNNPSIEGDAASVQALVTGIESGIRIEFDIYLQCVSIFGREAYFFETADPRYTQELLQGPIDDGGFLVTRPWRERYRVIRNANVLLEKLPSFSLAAADQSAVQGWTNTMIAFQLLQNITFTDSNGVIIDVAGETPGPVVSREQGLEFVAGLLDQGFGQLQAGGATFPFRVSSGFAEYNSPAAFAQVNRGLKARVEAYRSNWQGVLDALGGSFVDLSAPMSSGVYYSYSQAPGDELNPIFENQNAGTIRWLGHPSIEADAEAGDQRFEQKIFKRANVISLDGLSSDLGITTATSNVAPFPIVRNEELVLLRAEANINLGNLDTAQADVNGLRALYGLGEVTLTDANAIDQMLHERRYSLYAEGHRWVDLRRYNRLGTLPLDRDGDTVITQMPIPSSEVGQ